MSWKVERYSSILTETELVKELVSWDSFRHVQELESADELADIIGCDVLWSHV